MNDFLLFQSNVGGGGGSSDTYVQDVFQDTVLPATNNSGFSSTLSTNPFNQFFADDVAPKWMAKTLFIKDLVRVDDKSKWVNGKPTYQVVWNENFPGADGYAFGNAQLFGTCEDRYLHLGQVADGFGVVGVIQRVVWLVRPQTQTATVTEVIDSVNGASQNIGGVNPSWIGGYLRKPTFNGLISESSNTGRNIHDHRIIATSANTLEVVGAIVYYNVAGDGIDCFAGTAFLDKSPVTIPGSTLAFPPAGLSHMLGGVAAVFIQNAGFGVTTTLIPQLSTIAIGTINTNLLNVSTGTGQSFAVGMGIYAPAGSTQYIGNITAIGSDVLTVSPTLPFGVSNILSSLFQIGTSLQIGATSWNRLFDYQPGVQYRGLDGNGVIGTLVPGATVFPLQNNLTFSYSDPHLNYRVSGGFSVAILSGATLFNGGYPSNFGNTYGIALSAVGGSGLISIDCKASALEFEFLCGQSAALKATYLIDNISVGSYNETNNGGAFKRTVYLNAGVGLHNISLFDAGSTQCLLTRVTGYAPRVVNGPTVGMLANISVGQTFLQTNSQGFSGSALGNIKRMYADSLYFPGGSWALQPVSGAAGSVQSVSGLANDVFNFSYFGSRYAILGNGGSLSITVDGISEVGTPTYNTWLGTGLTLGFHAVVVTNKGVTAAINAVDVLQPVGEVTSVTTQDAYPRQSAEVRAFLQMAEPLQVRSGDEWHQDIDNAVGWKRFGNQWQRLNLNNPGLQYSAGASQAIITSSNNIALVYGTKVFDPFNMVDTVTPTFIITIPSDGNYLFNMSIGWVGTGASFVAGFRQMGLTQFNNPQVAWILSNVTGASTVGSGFGQNGTLFLPNLRKGNQISPWFSQNSGITQSLNGNVNQNFISCHRVGP